MNKIIKKDIVLEESDLESLSDLRRLNSKLIHDDISEESLAHFGIRGMKWGIRKDSSGSENRSAKKSRISMYKKRRIVSDDDLKKMVSRLETEKKLKSLVEEDIAPGRTAVRSQIAKFGTTALGAAAGYAGVVLIKRLLTEG